jgi:hypothetical protein
VKEPAKDQYVRIRVEDLRRFQKAHRKLVLAHQTLREAYNEMVRRGRRPTE